MRNRKQNKKKGKYRTNVSLFPSHGDDTRTKRDTAAVAVIYRDKNIAETVKIGTD